MKREKRDQTCRKPPGRWPAGGVILLCLGAFILPGSIYLSEYIKNLTYNSVDQGLIGIQDAALPLIEPMVKERGVAEVLRRVREIGVPAVEDLITQMGPAIALPLIRENALPIVHEMVNATFMAKIIDTFVSGFTMTTNVDGYEVQVWTTSFNRNSFFTSTSCTQYVQGRAYISFLGLGIDWSDNFNILALEGISNYCNTAIAFTATAQARILYGNDTSHPGSPGYIPGWLQDTDSGSGIADFLDLFEAANADAGLRPALQAKYDCTWQQLVYLNQYLRNYVEANRIPQVIAGTTVDVYYTLLFIPIYLQSSYVDLLGTLMPQLAGMTSTAQIADIVFYELWASGTALGEVLYPGGMDFGDMIDEIPHGATGFEACLPGTNSTGLTYSQSLALWNDADNYSLTNLDGIALWYGVKDGSVSPSVLRGHFTFLSLLQVNMLVDWLWGTWNTSCSGRFCYHLLPILLNSSFGYGVPIDVLAEQIIYEQWANVTVLEMALYPTGFDLNEITGGALGQPVFGLEPGVPMPLNLTMAQCYALWNDANPMSLLHMTNGIALWHAAETSNTTRSELMAEFGLSNSQMDILLDWLWCPGGFSDFMVPLLIESPLGYNMPLKQFCLELLYSQWANGTILGKVLFPAPGFPLPLKAGIIYGFEVGVPIATNMTVQSAYCLWNTSSSYSLVTQAGIATWTKAVGGDRAAYSTLKEKNGLTDHAMGRLIAWLPEFQHKVMPYLAQEQMNLPADSVTLANYIIYGGIAIGSAFIGLGMLSIARRAKKRSAWRSTGGIEKIKALPQGTVTPTAAPMASVPALNHVPPTTATASSTPGRPMKPVVDASKPTNTPVPASPAVSLAKSLPPPPPRAPQPAPETRQLPPPPAPPVSQPVSAASQLSPMPGSPVPQPALEARPLPTSPAILTKNPTPEARQINPEAKPVFEEFQPSPVKKDVPHASPLASYNMEPAEPRAPVELVHDGPAAGKSRLVGGLSPSNAGMQEVSNPVIQRLAAIGEGIDKFDSGTACADAIKKIEVELEGLAHFDKIKTEVKTWIGQLPREPWDVTTKKIIQKRIKNWVEKLA
ncbi:MAG: hypothetical protein Q6373_022820 [Candidatus Sigynarchaeota archaeon]